MTCKVKNVQPKAKLKSMKKSHQFTPKVSNLLESDLNLLECLMTDLVLPQDLLDQFPLKYKDKLSTGVTWYKNRTFTVNSWKILFTKFQTCLTKMEKSIITNQENYLKYILKQYEHFSIVKHCEGDMYMVEEAFFKIYKQKISQNLQKISQLSDQLPRNAGSINLLEDFQRKTKEKRKCLKVVRHMFEQDGKEGSDDANKTAVALNAFDVKESKKRRINEGFDFESVNLPKLNIDSCVSLSDVSKKKNLSGLVGRLKCQLELETVDEVLGDEMVTHNLKGCIKIDFKQICDEMKVIFAFADTKIDDLSSVEYDVAVEKTDDILHNKMVDTTAIKAKHCDETNEFNMDTSEDCDELPNKQDEEIIEDDFLIVESFVKIDYEAICFNIRLISELFDSELVEKTINADDDGVNGQVMDKNTLPAVNEDYSESLLVERSLDEETYFILEERIKDYIADCNAQAVSLEEILKCEDIIKMESLAMLKVEETNQEMPKNDEECTDYLISLKESTIDDDESSALLDEDDDLLAQHCAGLDSVGDVKEIFGNMLETSYEMVDEEISFLVHNNSKDEDDEFLLSEISSDTIINTIDCKDNENIYNDSLNLGPLDVVSENTIVDSGKTMEVTTATENIAIEAHSFTNSTVKSTPTAETKILFCSWMNASNDTNGNEDAIDEPINIHTDRIIEIEIEFKKICFDIAVISGIVKVEFNASPELSCTNEEYDEGPDTKLTTEEEDLLKQAFLLGAVGKSEENIDMSSDLDSDRQVHEKSAPMLRNISNNVAESNEACDKNEENQQNVGSDDVKDEVHDTVLTTEEKDMLKQAFLLEPEDKVEEKVAVSNELVLGLQVDDVAHITTPILRNVLDEAPESQIMLENKNIGNENMHYLDNKMKIVESFDDMFKSFLKNPMKSPNKEASEYLDVDRYLKSKEQLEDSGKYRNGNEKGVSQVLDELEKLDTTKMKVESKVNSKVKKINPRKPLVSLAKEDIKTVSSFENFDVKQEVMDKTVLLPIAKAEYKNEVITLDDDSDSDTKPNQRATHILKPKPCDSSSSPSVVYVPQNAKILHVPDNTKIVRIKTAQGNTSDGQTRQKASGINNLSRENGRKLMSGPDMGQDHPRKRGRPSKAKHPLSLVESVNQPQIRSRQSAKLVPEKMVQQAIKTVSSSAKRKNQIKIAPQRKSARLENDSKSYLEYVSDPESDGGNEQSELLEFISENIQTKAEMKPDGQFSYIYNCNMCPFKNRSKWHLENHVESTHGNFDVSYQCDLCNFIAKTRANYYAHGKKKHSIYMEPQY